MKTADLIKAHTDYALSARLAGVMYHEGERTGWTRIKKGKEFTYTTERGLLVRNPKDTERIHSLGIPPAWKEVWIAPSARMHLQATGIDARGRKQYLYHPKWTSFRGNLKYSHLAAFAEVLPKLRAAISRSLKEESLTKEKVAAAALELIDELAIRVGNDVYAEENKTYGVTTLRTKHISIKGDTISLQFVGKSHKDHELELKDHRIATILKEELQLPGQRLFQYEDSEGKRHPLTASDVNAFIQNATNGSFTAKDFRTWIGTVYAFEKLCKECSPQSVEWNEKQFQKSLRGVLKEVADHLGNTLAVTKAHYVHADLQEQFCEGNLPTLVKRIKRMEMNKGLGAREAEVAALLQIFAKERNKAEK